MNAIERITLFVTLAGAIGNSRCRSEPTTVADHPQAWPEAIEVFSWLPADIATFISASGPFVFPGSETKRQDYVDGDRRIEVQELREVFEGPALGPLSLNNGGLEKQLLGSKSGSPPRAPDLSASPGGLGEGLTKAVAWSFSWTTSLTAETGS